MRMKYEFEEYCCSEFHQEQLFTVPYHFRELNNINQNNYKKNKEEFKGKMKEDKPMNNSSFQLFGFLNRNFYIVEMKNYSWVCLLSFFLWIFLYSSYNYLGWCCLVLWNDKELYKVVLDEIHSNNNSPNFYSILSSNFQLISRSNIYLVAQEVIINIINKFKRKKFMNYLV